MTVPALPASCQWTSSVLDAAATLAAGRIPLVLPTEVDRARRWVDILGWYAPTGHTTPLGAADDVVISVGDCAELGRLAATALDRQHQHVPSMAAAAPASTGAYSVLLVADAADCTLSAMAPALDSWAATQTQVGLLTGRDQAGIVFSLAKILAARTSHRTQGTATALLDGPAGTAHHVAENTSQLRIDAALDTDWLSMLVDAHGSNAHAWLGSHVLCGLDTAEERSLTGEPLAGGCTTHRCKLAPNGVLIPVHPHELRAVLLGLFVCNAITLGPAEQYPSTVSLALDALDGYPAAVLGLLTSDADTNSLEPAVTAHLVRGGSNLGETACLLNEGLAHRGIAHGMLVLGDPTQTLPAHVDAVVPAIHLDTSLTLPVIVDGDQPVPALITPRRALLAAAPSDGLRAIDARTEADALAADLRGWTARLTEAHLMETALGAASPTLPTITGLAELASIRTEATQLVLATGRHLEQLHRRRVPGPPQDPQPALDMLAQRWATALATLVTNSPSAIFSHLADALTTHHRLADQSHAGPCSQCGTPRTRLQYTGPAPVGNRSELRCPRCGLVRSDPDRATAVMLRTPPHLVPGHPATINCMVDGDPLAPCVLSVQLRTRSASQAAYAADATEGSAGGRMSVTLAVPPETEPELHRAWALLSCRFQVSLALARIPAIPPYDAQSSIRAEENE